MRSDVVSARGRHAACDNDHERDGYRDDERPLAKRPSGHHDGKHQRGAREHHPATHCNPTRDPMGLPEAVPNLRPQLKRQDDDEHERVGEVQRGPSRVVERAAERMIPSVRQHPCRVRRRPDAK